MKKLLLIAVAALAATGAFAKEKPKPTVVEVPDYVLAPPPADQAQIVFVEPINKIQGMFPVGLFEIVDDKRTLLGMSWWKGKTVVLLPPGKHLLYASPNHMMEANVEAGKRYYVLLRFIYANGFQMRPLRTSGTSEYRTTGPEFAKWLKETRWVEKTPEADVMFADSKTSEMYDKLQATAMNNWQAKTAAEAAELTLNPEDAVAP
ncbi:MAG TPA: hypothetical protein VMF52_02790 [Steroidobacteraceae bacterium]|nr:hypothetical protein [Steroidobacteraceae bacterium]